MTRRHFLSALPASAAFAQPARKARIAITYDLEMSRNFPTWEATHWDYEKGNLDTDSKRYALNAARLVSETQVKRGMRVVHGNKELFEKLGRNDLCPCGSGRSF